MTGLFASNYANSQDNVIMRWCVSMCGCLFRKIVRATLHIMYRMPCQAKVCVNQGSFCIFHPLTLFESFFAWVLFLGQRMMLRYDRYMT